MDFRCPFFPKRAMFYFPLSLSWFPTLLFVLFFLNPPYVINPLFWFSRPPLTLCPPLPNWNKSLSLSCFCSPIKGILDVNPSRAFLPGRYGPSLWYFLSEDCLGSYLRYFRPPPLVPFYDFFCPATVCPLKFWLVSSFFTSCGSSTFSHKPPPPPLI